MISAVAFCPQPPVLLPEIAQGAAPELAELRAACRTAIGRVMAPGLRPVVLGAGPAAAAYPPTARGSLAGFGVALEVPLGSAAPGAAALPPALTIGAWLLRDALGPDTGALGLAVNGAAAPPALPDEPIALLVMGDGSARRSTSAPGYYDERAADFDAGLATALRSGTPAALAVDVQLGRQLLASAPAVWNVAAGLLPDVRFRAELLYDAAPYGVGYFVAAWTPSG